MLEIPLWRESPMIETSEQFERAKEAMAKMKRFLLAAQRTHAPEAYGALSTPILRELQERERDVLAYLRQVPEGPTGGKRPDVH
jgi:hypothetical protein